MLETAAAILAVCVETYLAIGVGFAVLFVLRGVGRIDPRAVAGSVGFRLLILPGCAALWPLLLRRWQRRTPPPEEHNPHRDLARRGARR